MVTRVLLSAVLAWCGMGSAHAAVQPVNLVANGNFEQALVDGWELGGWGDISATAQLSVGEHRNGALVTVTAVGADSGVAFVPTAHVPIQEGVVYTFTMLLRGACVVPVTTIPCVREAGQELSLDVEYVMGDGSVAYDWLGSAVVGSEWSTFSAPVPTPPPGAISMRAYPVAYSIGAFILDDVSLVKGTVAPVVPTAYLSIDFDDGWKSQAAVVPLLARLGVKATFNLNTEPTIGGWEAYLSWDEVRAIAAAGHEIASHTHTHVDLTTVDAARLAEELAGSREVLEAMVGATVSGFAYPYGAASDRELAAVAMAGYSYGRGVSDGINLPGLTNPYALATFCPTSETTVAEITSRIDAAVAQGGHLGLCFHKVVPDDAVKAPGGYEANISEVEAILIYAASKGVAVVPTGGVPSITLR